MSYDLNVNTELIIPIDRIEFTVFGNQEIKKYSIANKEPFGINIPESYDNNEPVKNGIVDSRLGTTDMNRVCDTCGENSSECPGHMGHTELPMAVYNYGLLDYCKSVLSCVCLKCSQLLIPQESKEIIQILQNKFNKLRNEEIKNFVSNTTHCPNCNAPVPKIKKETKESGSFKLIVEYTIGGGNNEDGEQGETAASDGEFAKRKQKDTIYASKAYDILRNISDSDCKLLGFDPSAMRPENFIIKNFIIPPIPVRQNKKGNG
jgi:DNA-directed RNA polymerase beta' subunit